MFCHIKKNPFMQAEMSAICHREVILIVGKHPNVIGQWGSTAVGGFTDILHVLSFCIYIANMSVEAVPLPKHMIAASTTNVVVYVVHVWSYEPNKIVETSRSNTALRDKRLVDIDSMTLLMKAVSPTLSQQPEYRPFSQHCPIKSIREKGR